jgi:hypothetical protein
MTREGPMKSNNFGKKHLLIYKIKDWKYIPINMIKWASMIILELTGRLMLMNAYL